jgi:thioredoxin-related protein
MKIHYYFFIMFFAWAVAAQGDEIDNLVLKVRNDRIAISTAQANYANSVRALNIYLLGNVVVVPPLVVPDPIVVPPVKPRVSVKVYGSESCAPCIAMKNVVKLLKEAGHWVEYTIDATGIEIVATPTIVCYVDGKEVSRVVGYIGLESMTKWITDTEKWAAK